MKRFKVLASAYACEPNKGSEPGVGWNWVKQIARFHEVWVITRESNRKAIEMVLEQESIENVHWVFYDLPHWMRFWKRGQRGVHLYYYLWQLGIYFVARKLHRHINFDLVHHVTFGIYWLPSFLAFFNIPFIWGPVGGGDSSPLALSRDVSTRGQIYEFFRDIARMGATIDPVTRLMAHRTVLALANTPLTKEKLEQLGHKHVTIYSHMGVSPNTLCHNTGLRVGPFKVVSIGRLLHWKGFHLGLMAFAQLLQKQPTCEYWIVGSGPEQKNLERLVHKLGIEERVKFWGQLDHKQIAQILNQSHALVHPSLHDSAPAVCLEAMAHGIPVICLDWAGPSLQVTSETGFAIPVTTTTQTVNNIAQAMQQLAEHPELCIKMGKAGYERIEQIFTWEKKADYINSVYQEAVNASNKKDSTCVEKF